MKNLSESFSEEESLSYLVSKKMSCLPAFALSISLSGVDPPAYTKFVDYTTDNLLPTDNSLARSTTLLLGGLAGATILSVIIILFITLLIVIIALLASEKMEIESALSIIVFAAACLAIYFAITYIYSKKVSSDVALPLQQDIRRSAILIANSIIRDGIYLSLCE